MSIHDTDSAQQVDHLLHDPSRGATPVFPVLDPLRAVGALAVVLTHVTFWTGAAIMFVAFVLAFYFSRLKSNSISQTAQ